MSAHCIKPVELGWSLPPGCSEQDIAEALDPSVVSCFVCGKHFVTNDPGADVCVRCEHAEDAKGDR